MCLSAEQVQRGNHTVYVPGWDKAYPGALRKGKGRIIPE